MASPLNSSVQIASNWGTGYVATVTLSNQTATPVSSWTADLLLPNDQTLTTLWDGISEVDPLNEHHVIVSNPDWGGQIQPGGTAVFGFTVGVTPSTPNVTVSATGNGSDQPLPIPESPILNAPTFTGADDFDLSWNSVQNATTYILEQATSADFSNPQILIQTSNTLFSIPNKAPGLYYYRVKAANTAGSSAYSNVQSVTVSAPPPAPSAPTLNAIVFSGTDDYSISWNSVSNATSYLLQQDVSNAFSNPQTVLQSASLSKAFVDQAVGTYFYRVQASNASGSSAFSNVRSIAISAVPVVPGVPVLNPIGVSGSSYTVSWNSVPNATSYLLQQDVSNTFSNPQTASQGSSTSLNVTNKPPGTYFYRVHASNTAGSSAFSNVQSATVVAPTPSSGPSVEGYWESWDSVVSANAIANMKVDIINISFANFRSLGNHTYAISGIEADPTVMAQLISTAHSLGKKVRIAVGGATYPLQNQLLTSADAMGMAQAIVTFLQQNNLDGVDLDIEDNSLANLQIELLKNLRDLLGNTKLISYTAGTPASSTTKFKQVIQGGHTYMTYLTLMAFDAFPTYRYQDDITALVQMGVPITKIVVGLMPGNDDLGRLTSVQDIATAATYVKQNNCFGMMEWSLNRDHKNITGLGVDAFCNTAYPIIHS